MPRPPSVSGAFRLAGPAMALVLAVIAVVRDATTPLPNVPADLQPTLTVVRVAIDVIGFAAFAIGFWWLCGREGVRAAWGRSIVLVLQLLLAIVIDTDLLILLAAELPLALSRRASRIWLLGQLLTTLLYCVVSWNSPDFELVEGLERAPRALGAALTIAAVIAWQALAFSIGLIAATEQAVRREVEHVNRELLATRPLLAENARGAERLRLARELHDTLGHHLTVLNVQLEVARTHSAGVVSDSLATAQQVSRLLLADVREVVAELRRDTATDLERALRELVAPLHTPRVELTLPDELSLADPLRAHALLRAAQEGLTNALRHAEPTHVHVALDNRDGMLVLTVDDNGRASLDAPEGNGLKGIRERAELVGGSVAIRRSRLGGWQLEVIVPSEEPEP